MPTCASVGVFAVSVPVSGVGVGVPGEEGEGSIVEMTMAEFLAASMATILAKDLT